MDSLSLKPKERQKLRPLTPLRLINGILCLIILISAAFVLLVFFGFWTAIPLRFLTVHHSRKATAFFFGCWIALWPFLFEKINKTKVVFSGDRFPAAERRVLLIANHRTEVDWMYLWDLALRKGCEGYIKYVLKSSLMKLPLFGWVFHVMEFIPVERKWKADELKLCRMLSSFRDPRDPLWLAVFPEGTDFTEEKCVRSQTYASENGLPIMKNVLLPKTKGFHACLENLRDSLDAVYDITIGYRHNCPSFLDNAFGVDPSEVHIHVRRISLSDIPIPEDQISSWLMNTFNLKDQMLSEFYKGGHFPNEGTEKGLSTVKCVVNFVLVMILTGTCVCLTLFYSIWFKIYAALVCAYLASATYFDIRPSSVIVCIVVHFATRTNQPSTELVPPTQYSSLTPVQSKSTPPQKLYFNFRAFLRLRDSSVLEYPSTSLSSSSNCWRAMWMSNWLSRAF